MDDESGVPMEPTEKVPLKELGDEANVFRGSEQCWSLQEAAASAGGRSSYSRR